MQQVGTDVHGCRFNRVFGQHHAVIRQRIINAEADGRAGRPDNPAPVGEIAPAEGGGFCQRMVRAGNKAYRFGVEHLIVERQLQRPPADAAHDDVHRARDQIVQQRGHHLFLNIEMQRRHFLQQAQYGLRNAVGGDRRTADFQASHQPALLKAGDFRLRTLQIVDQTLRMLKQQFPSLGGAQPFAMPLKQRDPNLIFEL